MYRILLLAQEEALYSRLEAFLDGDHYSVRRCDSPTAAHELMVQHIPDCILIDFRDPGFDPVFFCRTLKGNSRFQHVPIFVTKYYLTQGNSAEKHPVKTWTDPDTGILMFDPTWFNTSACKIWLPYLGGKEKQPTRILVRLWLSANITLSALKR
jgi:CheY-like chemotaxis protein